MFRALLAATHLGLAAAGSVHEEKLTQAFIESLRYDANAPLPAASHEESMWSTFQALPKNEYGRLDARTAGHAMQRYFTRMHSWRITGLEHESLFHADADVDSDSLPWIVDALFEADSKGRGFSLVDLTKLTEKFENLIQSESNSVDAVDVVEFQASCVARKDELVKLSKFGSGRVQLDAFSKWSQGKESVGFLQDSGAASADRLLIANYMVQPSSCKSSGTYHALCCVSSCLPILGDLEEKVQSPIASPGRLLQLVTGMSGLSTPVQASKQLAQELHLIAERHGGEVVPLHSEAFAQWLHRAFPNECPSPAFLRHAITEGSFDVTAWLRLSDVRALLPDVDLKDVGRLFVLGAIVFTMLRTALSQLGVASNKFNGVDEGAKKPVKKEARRIIIADFKEE